MTVTTMSGPISLRSSNLAVPRAGSIQVTAYSGTVDLRGAIFSISPQVFGIQIVW